jgi:hypothetical protein
MLLALRRAPPLALRRALPLAPPLAPPIAPPLAPPLLAPRPQLAPLRLAAATQRGRR